MSPMAIMYFPASLMGGKPLHSCGVRTISLRQSTITCNISS